METPDFDNPDMPLQVLFTNWPMTASVFQNGRMMCFGCPIAPFHTVIDACLEYGRDEVQFRRELNAAIASGPTCHQSIHRRSDSSGAVLTSKPPK